MSGQEVSEAEDRTRSGVDGRSEAEVDGRNEAGEDALSVISEVSRRCEGRPEE